MSSLQELTRELAPGFELEPDGKSHFKLTKDGELVRRANGQPVTVPSTTTRASSLRSTRKALVQVGAISEETTPKRSRRSHTKDAQLEIERDETERQGEERVRATNAFRKRLEPLLLKTGAQIKPRDLARIAAALNPELALESAATSCGHLLAGKALFPGEIERLTPMVEHFEKTKDIRTEWFVLLRETLGLDQPSISGEREWPFSVKMVPLDKLVAHTVEDGGYQRPVQETFVRDITLRFDERLVGTLDVSARKDGSFALIDGLQRSEAMRRVGKTACYCSVYEGLDVRAEAALFFHKNRDRKQVHSYYEFMARVVAEDQEALDIKRIVEREGFVLEIAGGAGLYGGARDRNLTAIRAVEEVYRYGTDVRPECLSPTLAVIMRNWFGRKDSLSVNLIRGLGRIFRVWGDSEIQWQHWEEQLAAMGPTLILGHAIDRQNQRRDSKGVSTSVTLVEIHNRGLPRGQRLESRLVESFRL